MSSKFCTKISEVYFKGLITLSISYFSDVSRIVIIWVIQCQCLKLTCVCSNGYLCLFMYIYLYLENFSHINIDVFVNGCSCDCFYVRIYVCEYALYDIARTSMGLIFPPMVITIL